MKDFRKYCDISDLDDKLKLTYNYKDFILTITDKYLKGLKEEVSLKVIKYDIFELTNNMIDIYNLEVSKKSNLRKYPNMISLNALQVAKIAMYYYKVSKFFWNVEDLDSNKFSLSFYQKDGYDKGLYNICNTDLNKILRIINPIMKIYEAEEALRYFKVFAPKVVRTTDKDLIPVNNGIFDYKNKKLLDFDPKYAFLSKSRVDFNKNAKLVNFKTSDGSYWNVEGWFKSLSNNKEMRELLWQITSAVIRPYVSWNKALIFYSFYDNNGKSVFCKLLENLSGKESYINLKIRNFNSDFLLNRLLSVNSIICDDNDFDIYLDKSETFNSLVNKKPIKITIYNKKPKTIVFKGLIVQGFNNLPKFKNGDDSMYNKFLPVLFDEYFEKSYIKDDFINSKEVLEYILYKALMSDFYEFTIPKSSNKLLYEICGLNNLVKNFLNEMLNECVWDLLPNDLLYELYKAWFLENISDKSEYLSKYKFLKEVRSLLSSSKEYKVLENNVSFEAHCKCPEPLIYKYDIESWMNTDYKGLDVDSICFPQLKGKKFRGVLRVKKRT